MMRRLNILYLLPTLLFAIASCGDGESPEENNDSAQFDGPFEIESGVIEYEDRRLNGEVKANLKFYFANHGSLMKLEETADGETSTYIFNDATGKGVTQFPGRKASKIFMRQGELSVFLAIRGTNGFTQQEDEEILGKMCEVQANNATTAEGEPQVKFWVHKKIPMKEINRLGMGYEFEAVKFDEKAVDKSEFTLSDGEMPHDIF